MFERNGPYRKHYFDETQECANIEVTEIPDGWKPLLVPRAKIATLAAAVVAAEVWILVAVSAISAFAH